MLKFSYFLLFLGLISCSNQEQNNQPTTAVNTEFKEKANKQLNNLEQFFNNENYLMIDNGDTSFIYFTRTGINDFYTHTYKLKKGDSTQSIIDTIQLNKENNVQWNWKGKHLLLQECNDTKALWQNVLNTNDKVDFLKISQQRFNISINSKQLLLTKTLPISLFLIRIKYDYEHKTRYAFDTTNFTKGK